MLSSSSRPPHRPRKRFGQHFLHDPRVLARLVDSINPAQDDFVVEIGPGTQERNSGDAWVGRGFNERKGAAGG